MKDGFDVAVCGSLNIDLLTRVSALPAPGETCIGHSLVRCPGGKGLNQAVAAARVGARTAMLGAIGDDHDGVSLQTILHEAGVDLTGVQQRATMPSGSAQVWVSASGENAIVVHPGANASVTLDDVHRSAPRAAVYLAQCEIPTAAVAAFLERGREVGAVRILNSAPLPSDIAALLPLADLVVLNAGELAALAHHGVGSESHRVLTPRLEEPEAVIAFARRWLASATQTLIVTLGAAGAVVVSHAQAFTVPARIVPVVDTTGAGDCFCGVLAASLAGGHALTRAVQRATVAASIVVGRAGAAPAMPTALELEATSAS